MRVSGVTHLQMLRAILTILCSLAIAASASEAIFYRAVNLDGPALTIDGHAWEGSDTKDFTHTGKTLENQSIILRPATDTARARMIRSSFVGDKVEVALTHV